MIPMFWGELPAVSELHQLFGAGADAYPSGDYPCIALGNQVAEFATPCHWSTPDVCSAPACIAKAYRELGEEMERMMEEFAA